MPHKKLKHILYIEDDEGLARLLQKRMVARDLRVDIAFSAEEGLEKIPQNAYDLILLDYHLPGMDGMEAYAAIQEKHKNMPVILLTSSGDEEIAVMALEQGVADYAVKDPGQTYLELLPAIMQAAYTKERLIRENEIQRQELTLARDKAETANEAKSNFLATMSHEIRTPLNVVIGLSNILARTPLNHEQLNLVRTLNANADLLLKLIDDLLDVNRIEAGQHILEYSDFSLSSVTNDIRVMFEEQARQKNIGLKFNDATGTRHVHADRRRLFQIIMNLFGNAIKFTEKGSVSLSAKILSETKDNFEVQFAVTDTGIGIATEKQDGVFDKFTQADASITRKYGGSGLGLSIVKLLLTMMQGSIELSSASGQGSVFTVTLPLQKSTHQPMEITAMTTPSLLPVSATTPILLVEDYAPNVMVATMILEDIGYEVVAASSGEEAIKLILGRTEPYYAILMDVQMHAMDGLQTTRHIREMERGKNFRHTIIGVTAHALAGDREKCISAGMDDYVTKPIHPDILASTLQKFAPQKGAA